MGDINSELGDLIAKSKTFGSSDNIRCGKYRGLIKRIFAEKVETGRFAFCEMKVVSSSPNPQIVPTGAIVGTQFDDGLKPNLVGSDFAMKVNFDGPGAKSAPANVRKFILGLFGLKEGEVSEKDVNETWTDFARTKDLHVGDIEKLDANNQPVYAKVAKQANPGCGMLVDITASMKEKKKTRDVKDLPPEKREYVTILKWECVARPGTGENAPEPVAKRRAEIDLPADDEVDTVSTAGTPPAVGSLLTQPTSVAPPPPTVTPAPPAPPVQAFVPQAPWKIHPTAPGWYFSDPTIGGDNAVKSEADLRAGK